MKESLQPGINSCTAKIKRKLKIIV